MGAVADLRITLSDTSGLAETNGATQVTANAFSLIGQKPIVGRDFASSDEVPGAAPVAILSYGFWQRRYTRDPATIGQTIRINGMPTTLIEVMPKGFSFPQKQDLWVPLVTHTGAPKPGGSWPVVRLRPHGRRRHIREHADRNND